MLLGHRVHDVSIFLAYDIELNKKRGRLRHGMQCILHEISRPSYSIRPFRYQPPGLRPLTIIWRIRGCMGGTVNGVIDFYLAKINQEVVASIFDNLTFSDSYYRGHRLNQKPSLS